ncbi:WD40 repeat-like protein [Fomitiporia mediterranea MF3/22]|uniref:WD40 repeat-like protein n=1 Tax=Fomitiporia mediterranea (strain MF3/22) TaxID=694068 RepID=UPI0004409CAE|nr:WD40 repeat-like protein [Fomitiporia mediterranea MF3/22]EJD03178.1 WD40 repeat-like protein [Fomitiporia mediterranea MF3/22]
MDWCKTPAPGQHSRPRTAFRLALGSFTEDSRNRLAIIGLQDERVLIEDDYDYEQHADFVSLVEAHHGYPATSVQWQPATAATSGSGSAGSELLATSGDALRVWEYASDSTSAQGGTYVGMKQASGVHRLTLKSTLSGSKVQQPGNTGAPITNFSWNEKSPSMIVTSSIDTTCTVWNIETASAVTQLIAHDREVYDVAWLPGSTDIFVSVGADGSLRAFDLRSLEHSTILYETPTPKPQSVAAASAAAAGRPATAPLLRIAFNPADANYMSTFHIDSNDVQILDMRSPGQPVLELKAHKAPINALGWGSADQPFLATAADDCQLLLWDITQQPARPPSQSARGPNSPRTSGTSTTASPSGSSSSSSTKKAKVLTDPIYAYTAPAEIGNICWSPQIAGMTMASGHSTAPGEWLGITMGKSIKALKV